MKNYKICLSVSDVDEAFKVMVIQLSRYADVDVVGLDGFTLNGYDIYIGKKLSKETLDTADRLKIVFAYKTGVDDFPLNELKNKNIVLVNSHADACYIAEYAYGLAISLLHRNVESDRNLRKGIWRDKDNCYWKSIFTSRIGLLGYGHIGKAVHNFLSAYNISTYTIDRGREYTNIGLASNVQELCDCVDLIIISLPNTKDTDKIIDAKLLEHLEGKYLVNVGRSNCIDEQALYEALESKKLAGAAIDTWDSKPKNMYDCYIPFNHPFNELNNVIISPHQAMFVSDGHLRYVEDITKKVIDYIKGGKLIDVVDLVSGY